MECKAQSLLIISKVMINVIVFMMNHRNGQPYTTKTETDERDITQVLKFVSVMKKQHLGTMCTINC